MKVCVLGNSHVACLKSAWEACRIESPGVELVFFASRGNNLSELKSKGSVLYSDLAPVRKSLLFTSGFSEQIDLGLYDFFLVCGVGFTLTSPAVTVSRQLLRVCCEDQLLLSPAYRLVRLLNDAGVDSVFLMHQPLVAQTTPTSVLVDERLPYIETISLTSVFAAELGIQLVPQPLETVVSGNFTHPDYLSGSQRLNIGDLPSGALHSAKNKTHMNAQFGALWLRSFFNLSRL